MTAASNKQTIATAGGTPIVAEVGGGVGHDASVKVTLSSSVTFTLPVGFPQSPHQTGAEVAKKTSVFGSGTVLSEYTTSAAALVAAGKAHY